MNNIRLIISREYLTRVRKKSFIILTLLGPLLMAAVFVVPIWLMKADIEDEKTIGIIDECNMFYDKIPDSKIYKFEHIPNITLDSALNTLRESDKYFGILHIPCESEKLDNISNGTSLNSTKQPSANLLGYISKHLEKQMREYKAVNFNLTKEQMKSIETKVNVRSMYVDPDKEERREEVFMKAKSIIGYVCAIIIYMFIFMYGAMIMRGVIEEKTNRIVEVLVSSVKPFELMLGKIVGIALVGLTQFVLWVVLAFALITAVKFGFPGLFNTPTEIMAQNPDMLQNMQNDNIPNAQVHPMSGNADMMNIFMGLGSMNYLKIIFVFLFYFIGGYLLYGAMFAAIGAAVDNETDTNQFMFPITVPMVIALVMISNVITNPDGPIAMWFSQIPFTSPVIMMVRIPFESVKTYELLLSMFFVIVGFLATTWLAAKIYRTGILMYGKKVNYKVLWQWIKQH